MVNLKISNKKQLIKVIFLLAVILLILGSVGYAILRFNSYNIFSMNIPKKIPLGFKRISMEKTKPVEGDWVFMVTYENSGKQQIIFNQVPKRSIRCQPEKWQDRLAAFRPAGSSDGCSFYLRYLNKDNKQVQLHWFLWNIGNSTYNIYDRESVLTEKQAADLADSLKPEIIIAKVSTNFK